MTEKTQQPKGIFTPYMKHYGYTPEEQLKKNKLLRERFQKWIEKTQGEIITEEEAKARHEYWELVKQIIDRERPAGTKLFSEK